MLTWGLCSLLKGSAFPCEALAGCKALVVLSAHLASLLLEPGPAFLREALADALKSNRTVACINLGGNHVEEEGQAPSVPRNCPETPRSLLGYRH